VLYLDSSRECKFSFSDYGVNTFDGLSVPFKAMKRRSMHKIAGCTLLMAQDISDPGLFSIMAHGEHNNWTVKVLVPQYEIEWIKTSNNFSIKINGVRTSISRTEPIVLHKKADGR